MQNGPRLINTPFRPIEIAVPEGVSPNEFFNSAENLKNLRNENGLLDSLEGLLMYRKAIGHSLEFDTSIMYNTAQKILNPLGRPVRHDQVPPMTKRVWTDMSTLIIEYMLEKYPDPEKALIICGEASLDPTWPLNKPGVPSIRMIHNHFIVFPKTTLKQAELADPNNPNLTDGGHHNLFYRCLDEVYQRFFAEINLQILKPIGCDDATIALTNYPKGLPSWEVQGGVTALRKQTFWAEYQLILKGFLDFYRTFFGQISTGHTQIPEHSYFPDHIGNILHNDNAFQRTARDIRHRVTCDPQFANQIRWEPAYKQLLYRDDKGRLIVTISQNSVGNAITELLGIVVKRVEDADAYKKAEPALLEKLIEVRNRLVAADLGWALNGLG